jgi:hypothetical protein
MLATLWELALVRGQKRLVDGRTLPHQTRYVTFTSS